MPGLAIALIIGVLVYEVLMTKPSAAIKGQSAARSATSPATGAAATTSALSSIEKLMQSILKGPASSNSAKPSLGAPGGFGSPSGTSARPSQTGFNQPSNQGINTVTSPGGGTVTYNNDGTVTIDGFVYDQEGNLVTAGPDFPGQIQQSAPGDGTNQDPFAELDQLILGGDTGAQDAALIEDASAADTAPLDPVFDNSFVEGF